VYSPRCGCVTRRALGSTSTNDFIIDSLDGRINERRNGEIWSTASGPISLAGGLRWVWHQMSGVHGLVDPTPNDAPLADKLASRRRIVTDFLESLPDRAAVLGALDAADLAWGELRRLGGVLESPTLQHRKSVAQIDDRAGGTRPVLRSPYQMSASGRPDPGVAPHLGEHNADVLTDWLNASTEQVDHYIAAGVLRSSNPGVG
jgi:CoA:oxalate CoA-transferase